MKHKFRLICKLNARPAVISDAHRKAIVHRFRSKYSLEPNGIEPLIFIKSSKMKMKYADYGTVMFIHIFFCLYMPKC